MNLPGEVSQAREKHPIVREKYYVLYRVRRTWYTDITAVWIPTQLTQAAGTAGGSQEGVGFPTVARIRASHSLV